jgi:hypothetical protein
MKQIVETLQGQTLVEYGITLSNGKTPPTIGELIEWIKEQGYDFTIERTHDDGSDDWVIYTWEMKLTAHGYELIDALVELAIKIKEH